MDRRRRTILGGAGGVVFAVFTIVGSIVANPPGGSYTISDINKWVTRGHRAADFVGLYLALIGVLGLVCLLARLREAVSVAQEDQGIMHTIFWGTGLAGATSIGAGWGIALSPPIFYAFSSGGNSFAIPPSTIYAFTEAGDAMIFGAGGILIGFSLITLFLTSSRTLPAWVRWSTLVGGIAGLAAIAFFPSFVLLLWSLVIGIWMLASSRADSTQPRTAAASSG